MLETWKFFRKENTWTLKSWKIQSLLLGLVFLSNFFVIILEKSFSHFDRTSSIFQGLLNGFLLFIGHLKQRIIQYSLIKATVCDSDITTRYDLSFGFPSFEFYLFHRCTILRLQNVIYWFPIKWIFHSLHYLVLTSLVKPC